jgi:Putative auto-transporter adhesin, head GIN domain
MRSRVALALGIALLLLAACSSTKGSGQLATAQRTVSGFTKVELAGQGDLTIEQTGTESLTISAEDNLLPLLTSDVSGDTLVLGTKPNTSIVTTKPITYSLTVKDLNGLAVSGSGTMSAPKLAATELSIKISGSGTITVRGAATDQDLEISGSGRYQADELTSKTVTARISGSGNASVMATDVLDVAISGSGSVTYSGNPQVKQEISGSGELIKNQ